VHGGERELRSADAAATAFADPDLLV